MKRALAALPAIALSILLACSDDALTGTVEPTTQTDGGHGTCEETAYNPASCTTAAGKTYSFIQSSGGGTMFTVVGGSTVELTIDTGDATMTCAAGATCDVVLNGGSVSLTCAATAKCSLSCSNGSGTIACATATDCTLESSGGQCVQR